MMKVPVRISNFGEEKHFRNENDFDFSVSDENQPRVKSGDGDELSNLLSYAMNLFYHHDYRSLKEVADRILSFDYRNIRGCLYKSFSEFFDQFDQYEFEVIRRWNEDTRPIMENAVIPDEDFFNDASSFDFINDINRYLEYVVSLEDLSKKLHQISEVTELLREEEMIQELIIERLVFLDQRISVTVNQEAERAQLPHSKVVFNSLKRLYVDKYEEIIAKREQILSLSEKEFCIGRKE
jgi:hypothetical protein